MTNIWNLVSSTTLSAGAPNLPATLASNIQTKSWAQVGRSIQNNTNTGYASNNNFTWVNPNNLSGSSSSSEVEDELITTAITPITLEEAFAS